MLYSHFPRLKCLSDLKFLGNFVLFERSEFTKFPLKKFQSSEDSIEVGVCSLVTFLHKQESNKSMSKVSHFSKNHHHIMLIRRINHFLIAH